MPLQDALERCTDHVVGIDVHPVAVLFARVTYLLAIGADRLRRRTAGLSVPVYLGDALQWDIRTLLSEQEIEIAVPGEPPLRFPGSVAGDPLILDSVLRTMRELADQGAKTRAFDGQLNAYPTLSPIDRKILSESYERMRSLHEAGRDHIWTYIVRNLTRPLWLSLRSGQPALLVGNPPWLRYSAMSSELQRRFKKASQERGLWVGGKLAPHQDLSAYFFARSAERYLQRGGRIAFVMPLATLSRGQYEGFRRGRFADRAGNVAAIVRIDEVWTFDSDVKPLFEVPSCVIFGHRDVTTAKVPQQVLSFGGELPRRDASAEEAVRHLAGRAKPWPAAVSGFHESPYGDLFKQGATIVPRRLTVVVSAEEGRFGVDPNAPLVESRTSSQEKLPWKTLQPLRGQVEREFIRPLMLGESIAPYRVLSQVTAIIPWDTQQKRLLDAAAALDGGHRNLASWLRRAELMWNTHRPSEITLGEQLDYYAKLSSQFPLSALRVVYAKAGTLPAACLLRDETAVVDHKLYWYRPANENEGSYLTAILNSEAVRARIAHLQSQGQWGARDFDKVTFSLPIPLFDPTKPIHVDLAAAAVAAEQIAARVELPANVRFQSARGIIRAALVDAGVAERIDTLVLSLLEKDG